MKLGPLQQEWVNALRSGKYKQGKDRLRKNDSYCCLGVACEIFKEKFGITVEIPDSLDSGYYYNEMITYLPNILVQRLHFYSSTGRNCFHENSMHDLCKVKNLSDTLNDQCGLTFEQIATIIELYPECFFKESV